MKQNCAYCKQNFKYTWKHIFTNRGRLCDICYKKTENLLNHLKGK